MPKKNDFELHNVQLDKTLLNNLEKIYAQNKAYSNRIKILEDNIRLTLEPLQNQFKKINAAIDFSWIKHSFKIEISEELLSLFEKISSRTKEALIPEKIKMEITKKAIEYANLGLT